MSSKESYFSDFGIWNANILSSFVSVLDITLSCTCIQFKYFSFIILAAALNDKKMSREAKKWLPWC